MGGKQGEGARKEAAVSTENSAVSALLAKWLIPSTAVLFGVIGYVVQSAQASLLGVDSNGWESRAYLNSAADFLRESVVRLLTWPETWPQHFFLHRPFLVLYTAAAVIASLVALSSSRLPKYIERHRIALIATCLIASAVVLKFVLMDAPLLKIENLVSSGDDSCWALVAQPPDPGSTDKHGAGGTGRKDVPQNHSIGNCAAAQASKGAEARVWNEAREIAGEIVCSRVTPKAAKQLPAVFAGSSACRATIADNKAALEDEFLCNLLLEIITIGGAIAILRRSSDSPRTTALCLLIIFYGLTAPYSYGKVGISPLFDFGDARITETLNTNYQKDSPDIVSDGNRMPSVIVRRESNGISILTMRTLNCSPTLSGESSIEQRVSFSFIPNAQLLSFDEIYKGDLITWLATQHSCPPI